MARPRRNVVPTKAGTWYVRPPKRGMASPGTFKRIEDANAADIAAQAAVASGVHYFDARSSKITVGDLATEYLAANVQWDPRTRTQQESNWNMLRPTFGTIRIKDLTALDVEEWMNGRIAAGKATGTIGQQMSTLRRILGRGVRKYRGMPNVAREVQLPRHYSAKRKPYNLNARKADRVAAIWAAVPDRYRVVVALAITLGLRSSELRGLTVDRIDLSTGLITIDRQIARYKRGTVWPEESIMLTETLGIKPYPKTEKSVRVLRVGEDTLAFIREHLANEWTGPEGLLVSGPDGGAMSPGVWGALWKRIATETGITFTGHDFRHYAGSVRLTRPGTTYEDVAAVLGNSATIVQNTYSHTDDEPEPPEATDSILRAVMGREARESRVKGHLRAV